MSVLQINSALCDGEADKGLIQAWKAIMALKEKAQELSWNGNRPTFGQIIDLFMSRSMFYLHFRFFDQAVKHPEMLEWLEDTGACSDLDVWGKEKNFVDLKQSLKKVEVDGESSSDSGRKKGKKVMKKESEKEESSHKGEKKSHKGKGKAAERSFFYL